MAKADNPKTSNQETPGICFEVDREVTCLSPHSAEGKALQRIEAIEAGDQVEWITVFDPDESVVDAAEVEAWLEDLNKSGYVTSEESTTLTLDEIYKRQRARRGLLTKEQLHTSA